MSLAIQLEDREVANASNGLRQNANFRGGVSVLNSARCSGYYGL